MTDDERWSKALALLGVIAPAGSALDFTSQALRSRYGLQVSAKATAEGLVNDLCNRFAPALYLDYELRGRDLFLWRKTPPEASDTISELEATRQDLVVGKVATMAGFVTVALEPLNDGGELHFLLIPPELVRNLRNQLGQDFEQALRLVTPLFSPPRST